MNNEMLKIIPIKYGNPYHATIFISFQLVLRLLNIKQKITIKIYIRHKRKTSNNIYFKKKIVVYLKQKLKKNYFSQVLSLKIARNFMHESAGKNMSREGSLCVYIYSAFSFTDRCNIFSTESAYRPN